MITSFVLFWCAIIFYVASSVGYAGALTFGRSGWRIWGGRLACAGLLAHSVSLGFRWAQTGHGPYINTFEILSSDVWIAVAFFLILQKSFRRLEPLGAVVMPIAFLMMGFALMGSTEAQALPPSLRSGWLAVHVIFAKLMVASMITAVALSVFYLLKSKGVSRAQDFLDRLPGTGVLDDYAYRVTAFGFIALTVMIIAGSIWANYSWGEYWSWDPTETWSLVVWFVYGLYLHGRITFRWKGSWSAWYLLGAFVFALIAFFVIPYFVKSLHSQYMVK